MPRACRQVRGTPAEGMGCVSELFSLAPAHDNPDNERIAPALPPRGTPTTTRIPTMTVSRLPAALLLPLLLPPALPADPPAGKPADKTTPPSAKMELSKLTPSKIAPDLCLLRYRISTASPECQAFFDQ